MAYYTAAWNKAVQQGYVTTGTNGSAATDGLTKGWIIFEMCKMGLFTQDSTAASTPYYNRAWQGAKNAGIISDSSTPSQVPNKGWIIFVLYKAGAFDLLESGS